MQERYPPDPRSDTGVYGVLRHGGRRAVSARSATRCSSGRARDPEHLELLRSVGLRSAMLVPMRLRDRVLGVISFVSAESGRRFDEHDLALAEDLALRAAAAVENARLYETACVDLARRCRPRCCRPCCPSIPALELAAAYRPAGLGLEVGGDFYDVFSTAEDQWYAVIGDVCGKGAEAAAVTALARYTIRAAAVRRRSPERDPALAQRRDGPAVRRQPALLHDRLRPPRPQPLPRARDRGLRRASAAARRARRRDDRAASASPGTLLGLVEHPELTDRSAELRSGDTIVLYTDGLTEAGAPEQVWTPEEIADAARGAAGAPPADTVEPAAGGDRRRRAVAARRRRRARAARRLGQPQRPGHQDDDVAADADAAVLDVGDQAARAAHLDALVDLEMLEPEAVVRVQEQRAGGRPRRGVLPSTSRLGNERARARWADASIQHR